MNAKQTNKEKLDVYSNKNEKSEDYSKADFKQRVLFFITIFRLAIPAFFRLQMLLNLCRNDNIIKTENVAIEIV